MNKLTTALLLGVSLIASPVYGQSLPDGDDDVPGNGAGNDDPAQNEAPGHDRDTDKNAVFANRFGGGLSSDPVTARMVSDYVHGARALDHITSTAPAR